MLHFLEFSRVYEANGFVNVTHFHPSIMYAGKARILPIECSPHFLDLPANIRLGGY